MNAKSEKFDKEMPRMLAEAGYGLDMNRNKIDLSYMIYGNPNMGEDVAASHDMRTLMAAGYLATNVSPGRFDVLKHIVTFDPDYWRLFVHLVKHFGIDQENLSTFIELCDDAMQFRLLAKLVGELSLVRCVDSLCRRMLSSPSLDRQFDELRQEATPIRKVVAEALASMPNSILPVLEGYLDRARAQKRWREKQVIDSAIKHIKAHN